MSIRNVSHLILADTYSLLITAGGAGTWTLTTTYAEFPELYKGSGSTLLLSHSTLFGTPALHYRSGGVRYWIVLYSDLTWREYTCDSEEDVGVVRGVSGTYS